MIIYPAIDLLSGKAVRLLRGDYEKVTVYSDDPPAVALAFQAAGATRVHLVDLDGARDGNTPNFDTVSAIKQKTGLFCEVGGGVRDVKTVARYLSAGIDRVILGTAAVTDGSFLREALATYGEKIAVGVDIKDGFVAIRGWTEKSSYTAREFFAKATSFGARTFICTDVSRDGAMAGANHTLYRSLMSEFSIDLIASGGVSSLEDVRALAAAGLSGAIVGKAYYTGAIDLAAAIREAQA